MAIDSTLFAADIPAGTYAVGDVVQLGCIDGPANVRSGRGPAKLKNIVCAQALGNTPFWKIHVKNSDWIDDVQSFAAVIANYPTIFADESGAVQNGHDNELTQNSGWQVWAECVVAGAPTAANSIYALIDIDYPQVGGVTDPKKAAGFPTSISFNKSAATVNAIGTMTTATWETLNVDYLKAGYRYVLDAVEVACQNANVMGFVAFSNAAGMGGLTRIIPVTVLLSAIRYNVRYSSVLVKGPMDVKTKFFAATAATADVYMAHDYVKQKA